MWQLASTCSSDLQKRVDYSSKVIRISFTRFCTESGWDFVTLYDGNDQQAPQIARISGCPPTDICFTALHGAMYVTFTSDSSVVFGGFNATYATVSGKDCRLMKSALDIRSAMSILQRAKLMLVVYRISTFKSLRRSSTGVKSGSCSYFGGRYRLALPRPSSDKRGVSREKLATFAFKTA